MMPPEMTNSAEQDKSAVAAVRRGDAERYRELVERYERRVFALAWSRLGDATLAEDATQEAFIRAYHRLWLLDNGAKFSGWISAIARRVAINFGLRHRRELDKCHRWALENFNETAPEKTTDEGESPLTPETLRQTLAELPDTDRECLVLFYLEGKSGVEAAAALNISEAAFRVRLHRARGAMRERLEKKLEDSLEKLGPPKTVTPAVMAFVTSSTKTTIAAGLGAKILPAFAKTFLFSWLAPLFLLVGTLPGLITALIIARKERENFRDTEGFRPELHRRFYRSFLWGFPLFFLIIFALDRSVMNTLGMGSALFFLAGFCLITALISGRLLTICRNPYQVGMFVYCMIIAVGLSAQALGWIPTSLGSLPLLAATIVFFLFYKQRPMRMDYSLFLRAAQGLLKPCRRADTLPPANPFDRRTLLAFARFLGSHFLVSNFRWGADGLLLRLPPVTNRFLTNMANVFSPPITGNCSCILLRWDGAVIAHGGRNDLTDLSTLNAATPVEARDLEEVVAEILSQAWLEFREGNCSMAGKMLGNLPEADIFLVPPARSTSMRWWRMFISISIALMMLVIASKWWAPAWLSGLKPVSLSETQVRAFLGNVSTNPNPVVKAPAGSPGFTQKAYLYDPSEPLLMCLVLPGTNLFTGHGLQVIRDSAAGSLGFDAWRQNPERASLIFSAPEPCIALVGGWISWDDLNLTPEAAAAWLRTNRWMWMNSPKNWSYFLAREEAWSWVKQEKWDVMRIQSGGLNQLRLLHDVNCLDLVDREKLIEQVASVQVLSGTPAPGQPQIHDWRDVRGLFFTPCYPALQDTYYSLAALQVLGGLDRIDREQCIEGILRLHRGKGFFTSPRSGNFNEYHVDGNARDTIAAYESLRILGALGRVKDLDQWQFRPRHFKDDTNQITWNDIEAWVSRRRLDKIIEERKENPNAPYRSLLEQP
jgi:RNA polymerase sigma-70 factor (ECF subfamily)